MKSFAVPAVYYDGTNHEKNVERIVAKRRPAILNAAYSKGELVPRKEIFQTAVSGIYIDNEILNTLLKNNFWLFINRRVSASFYVAFDSSEIDCRLDQFQKPQLSAYGDISGGSVADVLQRYAVWGVVRGLNSIDYFKIGALRSNEILMPVYSLLPRLKISFISKESSSASE